MRHLSRGARCAILLRFDSNGTGICAGGGVTKAMKEARNTEGVWPYLALLAGMVCIAWSAIFVPWTDMPGPASAFYRLLIPTIVLLPTWFFKSDKERLDSKLLAIIAVGGLFFALDLAFYNTGEQHADLCRPSHMACLPQAAAADVLAGASFGHRRLDRDRSKRSAASRQARLRRRHGAHRFSLLRCLSIATERVRTSASTLGFLRLAILSSTVFLLVINLAMRVSRAIPRGHSWAALLGLGLVSQLGGYLALTHAMGHLPATVTSVSLLAQVPLTALLAALLLGELLTGSQILGGMLVLAGVGLASRRSRPAEEANATLCEAGEHE